MTTVRRKSADRTQLYDNLYVLPHFKRLRAEQDASIDPGLFYRVSFGSEIEFICIDTSKDGWLGKRYFNKEQHQPFIQRAFSPPAPTWRIPFFHHPANCAGPQHRGKQQVKDLLEGRARPGGVRVVFCGHEHNFQHARHNDIDNFVTGGGGEFRTSPPTQTALADENIVSWGGHDEGHFLLVEIEDEQMRVTPYGKLSNLGELRHISITPVQGHQVSLPIIVNR